MPPDKPRPRRWAPRFLQGTDNQFSFTTARYCQRPLVITGPGAGPPVTAAAVHTDLLRLVTERGERGGQGYSPRIATAGSNRVARRAGR